MRNKFSKLIFFTLFCIGVISPALADKIEISGGSLSDVYTKEIGTGKKATVKIYLKSAGDPLDGYIVQFFNTSGRVPVLLAEKKTDPSGIITMNGIVAGRYLVIFKRTEKSKLSVDLGDIRIFKEGL